MDLILHDFEYNDDLHQLDIYFSLDGDEEETQRFISLIDLEIIKYTLSSVNLSDLTISDIVEEPPYVMDILTNYLENDEDNLPDPEYI